MMMEVDVQNSTTISGLGLSSPNFQSETPFLSFGSLDFSADLGSRNGEIVKASEGLV